MRIFYLLVEEECNQFRIEKIYINNGNATTKIVATLIGINRELAGKIVSLLNEDICAIK